MFKKLTSSLTKSVYTLALFGLSALNLSAQDAAKGKEIFDGQCASCHAINDKLVGPALKDVHTRREEAWLIKWIRNSQALIKSGDPTAVNLFKEYQGSIMSSFENLSDEDIKGVLAYIKQESEAPAAVATAGTSVSSVQGNGSASSGSDEQMMLVLTILAAILLIASLVLWRINGILTKLVLNKHPEQAEDADPSWWDTKLMPWVRGLNPTIATLAIGAFFAVIAGGWFFEYANTEIGVQQGYAPTQPINFSHELHAGQYKIDCQYCHNSAAVSKQASVPAINTCMNCHKWIDAKEKYNGEVSPEIQKVRDAYEKNVPVKWVRIHNLPDHAYFNHAQHVSIGKVECQTCHGPIETMEKVAQHSSLQMGWCINCHRESKVDVANNDYYEQLHADLHKQGKKAISVANNGGLECGKCHY